MLMRGFISKKNENIKKEQNQEQNIGRNTGEKIIIRAHLDMSYRFWNKRCNIIHTKNRGTKRSKMIEKVQEKEEKIQSGRYKINTT